MRISLLMSESCGQGTACRGRALRSKRGNINFPEEWKGSSDPQIIKIVEKAEYSDHMKV